MSDPLIVWGLITAASIDKHSDLGRRGVVLQGGNHQSTWQFGHLRTHTQKQFYHHQGIQQNRSLEKDGTSIQYLKKNNTGRSKCLMGKIEIQRRCRFIYCPSTPGTTILITSKHTWTSWKEWAARGERLRPARGCARDWPALAAA